jgi:hypothetical protein
MIRLKCKGCNNAEGFTVVGSVFGATSYALCDKCLREGREDYGNMVDYISCAGRWPEDINETYQTEVRRQLKLHNKTEEEFAKDVEEASKFLMETPPISTYVILGTDLAEEF